MVDKSRFRISEVAMLRKRKEARLHSNILKHICLCADKTRANYQVLLPCSQPTYAPPVDTGVPAEDFLCRHPPVATI